MTALTWALKPFLVPAYEAARTDHRAIVRVELERLTGWSFEDA